MKPNSRLQAMVLALALTASVSGAGGLATSSTSSRIVSPAVVASWVSYQNDAAENPTTLLVLWRGTPGWFERGPTGSDSGGGGVSGGRGSQARANGFAYVSMGGLTFIVQLDYAKKTAKILNREISLTTTNVVLVDFVDSANGPTIVGERWIDAPQRSGSLMDPAIEIIKRTSELLEYLRCDVTLPDSARADIIRASCEQVQR